MEKAIILFLLISVLTIKNGHGTSDIKSSLTFVIDDTGSMSDDIDQVTKEASNIFDTVMNSDASQIEDFVLVTFNDPDVKLRTVTKSKENFKNLLESIGVNGGGDCPEYSLSGIEAALYKSRPGSYFYVFTDAASKDYYKYETVNQLAKDRGSQIVFFLTGNCDEGNSDVYYSLAENNMGQVFNLYKSEVGEILNYVKEQVKSRKKVIVSKKFSAGKHDFNYTVDGNMKELVVSVTGLNPHVDIFNPEGIKAETEELVDTERIAIVKVTEVKPGVYKAEVKSDTETTAVVSCTDTLHFQYGFSLYEPTSIEETATRPLPDQQSYLSIKLTVEGGTVDLNSVQILDVDQNFMEEMQLDLINVQDQFYVTSRPFIAPNHLFRIAIKGFDVTSKTTITRLALVPLEPQNTTKDDSTEKSPTVSIVGKSEVIVPYEKPLKLKCKVSAFPKPTIAWEDKDGKSVSSIVTQIEVPYDYVSYIEIESVENNNTYRCKASNDHGTDSKQVFVKTKKTRYFNVVEKPKGAVIEFEKEGRFVCQVNAAPPASIQWYKGQKELRNSDIYDISRGASVLTIKKMKPTMVGKYSCKARNDYHRRLFTFIVETSGIELPEIDKTISERRVKEGEDVKLSCRVIRGVPKPALRWTIKKVHQKLIKTGPTIILKKVTRDDAGTYTCTAYNHDGHDSHYIDLIVEYAPVIISDMPELTNAIVGETVHLPCAVNGIPEPGVIWLLNNVEVKNSKHFWIHSDFSISFNAALNTTGNLTCVAVNTYSSDRKSTILHVTIPATIDTPEESTKEVAVGSDVTLECQSHGYPEPNVRWIFFSTAHTKSAEILRFDRRGSLSLPRIQVTQQGYYTCVASNAGGSTNTTYEIKVLSPPYIVRQPGLKLKAVSGDLVFRIPCKTIGSPNPNIVWTSKGFILSKGTKWYDYESDGTLIIKNLNKESEGYYTCEATNTMGMATESFYLNVKDYPDPESTKNSLDIQEGKGSKVPCGAPHKKTDVLRWFKDRKLIWTGELTLMNVNQTDSGLYICRVSTFYNSKSGYVNIRVGYKPRFLYHEREVNSYIEFREGQLADMDCTVGSEPEPKVTWWHGGHKLNETGMKYTLRMDVANRGKYFCLANNIYGHIIRSFDISSHECKLNIQKEFSENQPLILSVDFKLPSFEIIDETVRIPLNGNLIISCPEGFVKFSRRNEIYATCNEGTNFIVDGTNYKFADLKCKEEIQPKIERTYKTCLSKDTELIKIGYDIRGITLEVYEVCINLNKKVPLFVKQEINKSMSGVPLSNPKWYDNALIPLNFDEMYDPSIQNDYISSVLGKWFHLDSDDECSFSKRQLVDPLSISPGLPQVATYSHLNVVPHWSTCNEKNWDSIEKRVRRLAKIIKRPLQVWTGISQQLQLRGVSKMENLFLRDWTGQEQSIPRYFWKVVLDPLTGESLAIIQVNVPDFSKSDISRFTLCRDICSQIAWMRSSTWLNVDRGYTYCCNTRDFESAFGFHKIFNSTKVLYKAI